MFRSRALACSFCGKDAAHVSKLVAGPKAYICDACVAEASRIMKTPRVEDAPRSASRSLWAKLADSLGKLLGRMRLRAA